MNLKTLGIRKALFSPLFPEILFSYQIKSFWVVIYLPVCLSDTLPVPVTHLLIEARYFPRHWR